MMYSGPLSWDASALGNVEEVVAVELGLVMAVVIEEPRCMPVAKALDTLLEVLVALIVAVKLSVMLEVSPV